MSDRSGGIAEFSLLGCRVNAGDSRSLAMVVLSIALSGGCWSNNAAKSIELLIESRGEGKIPNVIKKYNALAYQEKLTTVKTTEDGSSVYVSIIVDADGMEQLHLRVGQEVSGVVSVAMRTDVSIELKCEPPNGELVLVGREPAGNSDPILQLEPGIHDVEITFPVPPEN